MIWTCPSSSPPAPSFEAAPSGASDWQQHSTSAAAAAWDYAVQPPEGAAAAATSTPYHEQYTHPPDMAAQRGTGLNSYWTAGEGSGMGEGFGHMPGNGGLMSAHAEAHVGGATDMKEIQL